MHVNIHTHIHALMGVLQTCTHSMVQEHLDCRLEELEDQIF